MNSTEKRKIGKLLDRLDKAHWESLRAFADAYRARPGTTTWKRRHALYERKIEKFNALLEQLRILICGPTDS